MENPTDNQPLADENLATQTAEQTVSDTVIHFDDANAHQYEPTVDTTSKDRDEVEPVEEVPALEADAYPAASLEEEADLERAQDEIAALEAQTQPEAAFEAEVSLAADPENVPVEAQTSEGVVEEINPSVEAEAAATEQPAEPVAENAPEVMDSVGAEIAEVEQALAAHDTGEEQEEEEGEHADDAVDYSSLNRKSLLEQLEKAAGQPRPLDRQIRKIKDAFDAATENDRQVALAAFLENGGEEDGFEFRKDALAIKFDTIFRSAREARKKALEEIETTKKINLKRKQHLLDTLRKLVEEEETNNSIDELKRIQEEWRTIGQVPMAEAKELYTQYDFLLERFYNKRSIFYELKELDRKKNLDLKNELVDRAKKTLENSLIVKGLQEFHRIQEIFNHVGPAPREENTRLRTELKAIHTQLIERKKEHDEKQKAHEAEISAKREVLIGRMEEIAAYEGETIRDWQKKSDELAALQTEWKELGPQFRERQSDLAKRFWAGLKKFYAGKDAFFKKLDKERAEVMAVRREILDRAKALATQENKNEAQNQLKGILEEWKNAGQVSFKQREALNKEFSAALDAFFESKKNVFSAAQNEQRDNLNKKQALVDKLGKFAADKAGTADEVSAILKEFDTIGFVPIRQKDTINAAFKDAVMKAVDQSAAIAQDAKAALKLQALRGMGRSNPGALKELTGHRGQLDGKIRRLEHEVNNFRTNIDFLSSTKNGDKLKAEYQARITTAEEEIKILKDQLKQLQADAPAPAPRR